MEDGAKAELPQLTLGDIADMKMTLKIWDVPPELGRKFINTAKACYANKSWLLLQDLMQKADKYDQFLSSGKIADLEAKTKELDGRISAIEAVFDAAAGQSAEPAQPDVPKVPKTFGGKDGN